MNEILCYTICLFVIILGVIGSIKNTVNRRSVYFSLEKVIYYFSILSSILFISLKIDGIFDGITRISKMLFKVSGIYNDACKIGLLVVLFLLIQITIYKLIKMLLVPRFSKVNRENSVLLIIISALFGFLKGIIFLAILFIGIITYNNTIGTYNKIDIFKENDLYSELSDILAKNTSELTDEIAENFFEARNVIIYYNGVTIEEGIKSTYEIDEMAKELTRNINNDIDKARILYSWIGSNIEYDYERAEKALNNEAVENSGAISTFEKRSGICFDYSCLYVAMARAINLKVRLLTGNAYDGLQYGPHAWNEVYISELEKWVPVDTTFYLAGDYFNNYDFYEDHITENIAGEW